MICVAIVSVILTSLSIYYDYRRLTPILKIISEDTDEKTLREAKIQLLQEPHREACAIVVRWLLTPIIAVLTAKTVIHIGSLQYIVAIMISLVSIPAGYLYTFHIVEKELAVLLKTPFMARIFIEVKRKFNLQRKIGLSLFSVFWYPIVILGMIAFEIQNNIISLSYSTYHIIGITALMFSMSTETLKATEEQTITHNVFMETAFKISEAIQLIADNTMNVSQLSNELTKRSNVLSKTVSFFQIND